MSVTVTIWVCYICAMEHAYPWKKEDRLKHFLIHFDDAIRTELVYDDSRADVVSNLQNEPVMKELMKKLEMLDP